MKIIGLVGSPRAGGNTDLLVGAALEGARESGAKVEKILVKNLQIDTCEGCLACWQSGFCDRFDDDLPWLVEQLSEADGLVLGSPVWSGFLHQRARRVRGRWCRVSIHDRSALDKNVQQPRIQPDGF